MNFSEMNLNEGLVNKLKEMGIVTPTEIQEQIIPAVLQGRDLIAESETGSGKTLG
ncbi:MAG TPA: DEAD/DEAH box helicase, partial [Candidatus Diapherotrites archaeon]|nr:DEAD/DEAH box helicase [Candidatus Diapherotrites archaeon]